MHRLLGGWGRSPGGVLRVVMDVNLRIRHGRDLLRGFVGPLVSPWAALASPSCVAVTLLPPAPSPASTPPLAAHAAAPLAFIAALVFLVLIISRRVVSSPSSFLIESSSPPSSPSPSTTTSSPSSLGVMLSRLGLARRLWLSLWSLTSAPSPGPPLVPPAALIAKLHFKRHAALKKKKSHTHKNQSISQSCASTSSSLILASHECPQVTAGQSQLWHRSQPANHICGISQDQPVMEYHQVGHCMVKCSTFLCICSWKLSCLVPRLAEYSNHC